MAVFEQDSSEAVLLVSLNARNAVNNLKRQAALRNLSVPCPAIFTVLINTYTPLKPSFTLVLISLLSEEGTI